MWIDRVLAPIAAFLLLLAPTSSRADGRVRSRFRAQPSIQHLRHPTTRGHIDEARARRGSVGEQAVPTGGAPPKSGIVEASVPDGTGGWILAWEDWRNDTDGSNVDVYAQRLDASGEQRWSTNGIPLSTAPGGQWSPAVLPDDHGGAIVIWSDGDPLSSWAEDFYAQRVDSSGFTQWTSGGVPLKTGGGYALSAVTDGAGGAIVVWKSGGVFVQRVGADGKLLWSVGGIRVGERWNAQPAIAGDGAGGAFVAFEDYRLGGDSVFVQHVLSTGVLDPAWPGTGVPAGASISSTLPLQSLPDGAGGVVVVWLGPDGAAIHAQKLNSSGVTLWQSGGVVLGSNRYPWWNCPTIAADGTGGIIFGWMAQGQIVLQRVSGAGWVQWTSSGLPISTDGTDLHLASDGGGGAFVSWSHSLQISLQRVNGFGSVTWPPIGVTFGGSQVQAFSVGDHGGVMIAWMDGRAGDSDLYAQSISSAGAALWQAGGVPVAIDPGRERFPETVPATDGLIIIWQEKVGRNYDVFARKVGSGGSTLWPKTAICVEPGLDYWPIACSDGADGAIVAWQDHRDDLANVTNGDLYAQRIDATGRTRWTPGGERLCSAPGDRYLVQIGADGRGGAIFSWEEYSATEPTTARAGRVDSTGTSLWGSEGIGLCSVRVNQTWPVFDLFASGDAIFLWVDSQGGYSEIRGQRLDPAGVPRWYAEGVSVTSAPTSLSESAPEILANASGTAIVTWQNVYGYSGSRVYAQCLNEDGATQWADTGIVICTASEAQWNPALVSDMAGGAIVVWQDDRSGVGAAFAQRISSAGEMLWSSDGVALTNKSWGQWGPGAISDGAGGAIVVWDDDRADPTHWTQTDVYGQRVNAAGATSWANGGLGICTAPGPQIFSWFVTLVPDGSGGAYVAWQDRRDGPVDVIYAQHVDGSGASLWAANGLTPVLVSLVACDARPDGVSLTWHTETAAGIRATVYRRTESSAWSAMGTITSDGSGRLLYEDRAVTPDQRYGYRLGIAGATGEEFAGETWVSVPSRLILELEGARPNPARGGGLVVAFTLASRMPAMLELLDVSGRRLASHSLAGLEPGRHVLNMDATWRSAPGVYLIRLSQDGRALVRKACILR